MTGERLRRLEETVSAVSRELADMSASQRALMAELKHATELLAFVVTWRDPVVRGDVAMCSE